MQPGVSRCNPRSGVTLYNSQRDHSVLKVSTNFRGNLHNISRRHRLNASIVLSQSDRNILRHYYTWIFKYEHRLYTVSIIGPGPTNGLVRTVHPGLVGSRPIIDTVYYLINQVAAQHSQSWQCGVPTSRVTIAHNDVSGSGSSGVLFVFSNFSF